MGRPNKKDTAQKKETTQPAKEEQAKNVNPGDTATAKGVLDDAVVQSFDDLGFPEDHFMSNVKLGLGTLACLLAFVAQFWPNPLKPMPFPESRGLLLVCCVLYFAISFGLQLLATLHEKDAILYTFAPTATSPCYSPGMNGRRLRVGSSLPRFSVDYTLNIEVLDAEGKPLDKVERVLKLTDYFEEGGTFHEDWFMDDVKDAVVTHVGKRKGE